MTDAPAPLTPTECPDCGHPHLPMPGKWKLDDGTVIDPKCGWPMGPESCECRRRRIGTRALASQRSDGLGRSERAEERSGPDTPAPLTPSGLVCVLCRLSRPTGERNAATTIINGNASCDEHIDRLPWGDLSRAISQARQDREAPRG